MHKTATPSVAAKTGELPAVADSARRLVEYGALTAVRIEKIGRVVRRLQIHAFGMAEFATVGWIDLVVANQTIRHARHGCRGYSVGFFQAAMAGSARIRAVEMDTEIAGRRKVGIAVHGSRQYRGDIT